MPFQDGSYPIHKPAVISEFHSDSHGLREALECRAQALRVCEHPGRKLDEDGAQLPAQPAGMLQKKVDRSLGVAQAPDVCQEAAHFDGYDEVVRGLIAPVLEVGFLRNGVEGLPVALRDALRVEATPPISVLPAGRAYPEHRSPLDTGQRAPDVDLGAHPPDHLIGELTCAGVTAQVHRLDAVRHRLESRLVYGA